MKSKKSCHHCGAAMMEYTHSLCKSLLSGLLEMGKRGVEAEVSSESLNKTTTEWTNTNFQKLRYWDLIEKNAVSGLWKLSKRGRLFLDGQIKIYKKVVTYRGQRISYKGSEVYLTDVINPIDPDQTKFDYAKEATPH